MSTSLFWNVYNAGKASVTHTINGALQTLGNVSGAANTGVQALSAPAAQVTGGLGVLIHYLVDGREERRLAAATLHAEGKYKQAFAIAWPYVEGSWKSKLVPMYVCEKVGGLMEDGGLEQLREWVGDDVANVLEYAELMDLSHLACMPAESEGLLRSVLWAMAFGVAPRPQDEREPDDYDPNWVEEVDAQNVFWTHRAYDALRCVLRVQAWYLRLNRLDNYLMVTSREAVARVMARADFYRDVCDECAVHLANVRLRTDANEQVARRVFASYLRDNRQDMRITDIGYHIDGLCAYYFWVYANHRLVQSMFVGGVVKENL